MSEYKTLFGKAVKALASDPTDTGAEGQIWYNTTTGSFRTVLATGAWSSGSPLTSGPRDSLAGAGTQTAALAAAGRNNSPGTTTQFSNTDEYNGSGWSAGGSMGTARHNITGTGLQTAALGVGGYIEGSGVQSATEEYDGSSWTAGGALPVAKFAVGLAGIQTSAVAAGGRTPSFTNTTEEYNGTAWTAVNNMNTSRAFKAAMTGIETAAVAFGGDVPPLTANVEEYDGTTWTEVNNLPAANRYGGASGPQTSALFFGGSAPAVTTNAFTYDGTNFSATGSLGTAVQSMGTASNAPSNSTGLSFGGFGASTYLNTTEEFNFSTQVITAAAWSSGGNLNTARRTLGSAGAGTQNATLAFGGFSPSGFLNSSESYNGSSWTATSNLNTGRGELGGAGTQTAALAFGGTVPGATTATESWNGTSWTTVNSLNTGRFAAGFCGTQTAALYAGGNTTSNVAEEYDGTNWTTVNTMNVSRRQAAGVGLQTAAVMIGSDSPSPNEKTTSFYDGINWTAGPLTNISHTSGGIAFGIQSSHIVVGGTNNLTTAEQYDGSSYATTPSLGTGRFSAGRSGDTTNGVVFGGGSGGSYLTATEEFTGETSALNLKTITTS